MIKIKQIGASLSLMILLWNCSGSNGGNQPQGNTVKTYPVVEVQEKSLTGYFEFPANIMGKVNNNVRAKIQGYITKVLVDEGQYVQAGQPLFTLETNSTTETALAAKSGIGSAQAAVAAAQASVNAAQVEVNKLKPLVEKGVVSSVQLETANANLLRAQAAAVCGNL